MAPVLVVSDIGWDYGRDDGFLQGLCGRDQPVEIVCPVPEPNSTIGEARAFARLADERGWQSLAVVTSRGHLTWARLAAGQCTDADLLPVAADPDATPAVRTVRDEWLAAAATATLWRACW